MIVDGPFNVLIRPLASSKAEKPDKEIGKRAINHK